MPESKTRKGFNKRKAHNRLMLEHNRFGIAKKQQELLDKLRNAPVNIAEMLNEEEKSDNVLEETTEEIVRTVTESIAADD